MMKPVFAGLTVLVVLASHASWIPAQAQAPYWDNSSGEAQGYHAPGNYNNSNPSGDTTAYPYGQPSYGQPSYGQPSYGQPALRGHVSTAPPGTSLSVVNTTYLSSDRTYVGDPITVTLGYDLAMGGNTLLPSGTQIQGQVVSAIPAGRAGRNGQLQLRFNRAMLPDGRQIPLSARLITQDGTGIIRGGTGAQRMGNVAKNTLGSAAVGAATGTALGAIVGGGNKWNEGMLWGSILGAGTGLVRSGVQQGEEAEIHPGTQLQLMLDQPLTVSPIGTGQGFPGNSGGGYPY